MKKTMKIAGIALGVILLLLLVLPFAFQGKIEKIVKEEGNNMLNAQFDFRALDLSLLRNFPQASVTLKDFWLKGTGDFEKDTLVQAGELTATINLFSLFGNSGYDISKIMLENTRLHAIVLEDGRPNWDVMKPSENTDSLADNASESTPIRIKLKRLTVNNLSVIYDDRQANLYAEVNSFNAACSGDFGSEHTTVDLEMKTPSLVYRMGGVPFLNGVELEADVSVDADFVNNKYTLRDNSLRLNAIQASVDGWVALNEAGMDMDVKLNTNEVGFKELLSLIPAIYAKDFKTLKTDGKVLLTAFAKGRLQGDSIVPRFEAVLDVKNAMLRYPSLPAGIDRINIAATVRNPGGNIDSTTVTVSPFNFVMAGNPFSVKAAVKTPVSDPDFQVTAQGKLDLAKIKEVYPLEDMQLNGLIHADMGVQGKLSYIEKEQYEKVKADGTIRLNDMKLVLKDMPSVDVKRSTFSFAPRYLQLSETTVQIGKNDLTLDSRFENYLGYVLKGSTLKGTLNVSSNKFNLNDFMTPDTVATQATTAAADTTTGVIRVPENIDFHMQATMKEVLFNKMKLENINGVLVVKDGKMDMRNLSLQTMGGSVTVNGVYEAPQKAQPKLNAGFSLKDISFAQAYKELDMVQQLAPIFSGLNGAFSGNIKVNTPLDEQMSPVLASVQGSGALSTKDLSLSGVKFIDQLADIVKKPSLKDIKVKDLQIEFEIAEGRVKTKPFDLKLGEYAMNLSGSTGLDQTVDYKGKITMPTGNVASKLGTVDMNIGGTFTSPKVSVDLESLVKNVAEQTIRDLGTNLIKNATDSTKKGNVLDKALNLFKKKK